MQPVLEFCRLNCCARNLKKEGKSELNALIVVSEASTHPVVSKGKSAENVLPVSATELVAGLSRDLERIELALRKLMSLR